MTGKANARRSSTESCTSSCSTETDFDGWRRAARVLVVNDVRPSEVAWENRRRPAKAEWPRPPGCRASAFRVPAKFVELAKLAILHRNPQRFALLYRLLWRLRRHHDLLTTASDRDVAEALVMADTVQRDIRYMQAQLRFREIGREQKAHYVAWFKPAHRIVAAAAPFFASRFADMPWSILTPDACAHWDGHAVTITPGVAETPRAGRLEEAWRRYRAEGSRQNC